MDTNIDTQYCSISAAFVECFKHISRQEIHPMKFKTKPKDFLAKTIDGKKYWCVKKSRLDKFSPNLLGLGDISQTSEQTEALCAILDLKNFTKFCCQVDPYLSIPIFLHDFLTWFYKTILEETTITKCEDGSALFCDLPLSTKFLGDGLLLIWDVKGWSKVKIHNTPVILHNLQYSYKTHFLPEVSKKVSSPPTELRCGIARGHVYSVGDGNDFVGPCINMASRLQKLGKFSFAVSQRGFQTLEEPTSILISANVRGVGEPENIYVLKSEYEALSPEDKRLFRPVK